MRAFAARYGSVALADVGDAIVAEWLTGGRHAGTVPALRAMFNDAASAKAGRLVERNPFAGLGLKRASGNRNRQPPGEEKMWTLLRLADELTPPSFAAWLAVACFTAMRPGELDALQWHRVRFADGEVGVAEQWNVKERRFTEPKYGPYTVALVGHARETLLGLRRDLTAERFVFTTLRGTHYTPSARNHHWNRVRAAAGLGNTSLYLATRHYFGWYATNVLELPPHVVAEQLGHRDGGKLIVQLYGHPDGKVARRRIREAFDGVAQVRPLHVVRDDSA